MHVAWRAVLGAARAHVLVVLIYQEPFDEQRSGSVPSLLEDSIEILHRLSHGPFDRSLDKKSIEETSKTLSGFVFYDQTVFAACGNSLEVAFMANFGQPLLTANVSDAHVLLELFHFHIQGAFAIEQLDHYCCFIAWVAPFSLRGVFDTNEIGPIRRPVSHVRDICKRLTDRDEEGVTHFDANHGNLLVFS